MSDEPHIEFRRFKLLPHRRELLADDRPVELGGRAFDVLAALVEGCGRVLSKDALMERVWPGRNVDDSALQMQISALRKALGSDRDLIQTVSGRGYQFTGGTSTAAARGPSASAVSLRSPSTNLKKAVSELIGRDAELRAVTELLLSHPLVTLSGAGGIGKTRLALEVAARLPARFADGVWVAELAALSDPALVPVTVAAALGLTLNAGAVTPRLVAAALGPKQILLVLDNCEHVIDAVAHMSEALMHANPNIRLMATSRELLRTPGEAVYQVPPLAVPMEGANDMNELLQSNAVRLFMTRARATAPDFPSDRQTAAVVGAICRRLDGIPLAIELAAARAPALGADALAARLNDRFNVLTGGLRTALPRHRTLRATLDWSYDLLPEGARVLLQRLAVFAGDFTLEGATAVASSADGATPFIVDGLIDLIAMSLVSVDASRPQARYRLLETTRAYAMDKLVESGKLEQAARRHAQHHLSVFECCERDAETQSRSEWLDRYAWQIANARAALDWAFSDIGDTAIGVALTAAVVPLWIQSSLIEECDGRVQRALSSLDNEGNRDRSRQMRLLAAMGVTRLFTKGPGPDLTSIWTRVLEISGDLGDVDYHSRALWGLWVDALNSGRFRDSLTFAERLHTFASSAGRSNDALVGDRLMGYSLNLLGEQPEARSHTERVLSLYVGSASFSHIVRFQFDQLVMARYTLAWILWLQGFPDRAMRLAESSIADPRATDHAFSLCVALSGSICPISIHVGDFGTAERYVAMLIDHAARHAFGPWNARGRCFKGILLIRRGDVATGLDILRAALRDLGKTRFALLYATFLGELADTLAQAGLFAEARAAIAEAIDRARINNELWCLAELLRIKGEIALADGTADGEGAAEENFQQAVDLARKQGALSWQLRCTMSLARLWHRQGFTRRAREALSDVYERFTEGFATQDVVRARDLLTQLR